MVKSSGFIQQSTTSSLFSAAIIFCLCVCMCVCVRTCTQSCLTLCDPMDYSTPGSTVYGILQARILTWVSISISGNLPYPGIKPGSPVSPELAGGLFTTEPPGKVIMLDACLYTFVKTHRMHTIKNKPKVNCGLWVLMMSTH